MRFAAVIGLGALLSVSALGRPAAAAERRAAPAAPLKVAYVDLTKVLKGYERRKDLEADLKRFQAQATERDREKVAEINAYKKEIEQLALGTPDRLRLEEKGKAALRTLQASRRSSMKELNERATSMLDRLYADVLKEVGAAAEERGYDFVLKDQSRDRKPRSHEDIVLQISQRVVLYARPEHDLTETVLKRLNEQYRSEKKAAETKRQQATEDG